MSLSSRMYTFVYGSNKPYKKKIAFHFTFVYKVRETTLFMLLTTEAPTMSDKKKSKPQIAAPQAPGNEDPLSRAVPSRLYQKDLDDLMKYEKAGFNISDLVRRCVRKSLHEVVSEIRDEIQRISGPD